MYEKKEKEKRNSLNKKIQTLLRRTLGLIKKDNEDSRNDSCGLFGVWSKKDENNFNKKVKNLEEIDIRE